MIRRRPIVGVIGSGSQEWPELAEPLGEHLARRGVHLLTGGGGGVMTSVSRAFGQVRGRAGLVIGVLPSDPHNPAKPREGYPNEWIDLVLRTHLPLSGDQGTDERSRNHINILSADLIIALPGEAGTRSEVELAHRYERPVMAYLGYEGQIQDLPEHTPIAREMHDLIHWLGEHLREPDEVES